MGQRRIAKLEGVVTKGQNLDKNVKQVYLVSSKQRFTVAGLCSGKVNG